MNKATISIIGAGNVATHFGIQLIKNNYLIPYVYSKTPKNGIELAKKINSKFSQNINDIIQSDGIIIAINDNAIQETTNLIPDNYKGILIHTSGGINMQVLEPKQNIGVLYPFQTLSKNVEANLATTPLCIESNNNIAQDFIKEIANSFSKQIFEINSNQRAILHICGVFANNFTNCMYAIAEDILIKNGINREIILPLIKETAQKIEKTPAQKVQTGPAIRKDTKTMQKHIDLLEKHRDYQEIYNLISNLISKIC